MSEDDAWNRLIRARRGVLGTVESGRGVDLVPVVYAVAADRRIVVPVDVVKPKSTVRLKRLANISADPRCALLVDHYDDEWSQLWWVRVTGEAAELNEEELDGLAPLLADKYAAYQNRGTVVGGLVMVPRTILGWTAG